MTGSDYSVDVATLDAQTRRLAITHRGRTLSWRAVLAGWREMTPLSDALGQALASLPFRGFRWETPGLRANELDFPFECVAVDAPALDVPPDPAPFAEHLVGDRPVVRFPNLGGDALMVVPQQREGERAYAHLAAFLRAAPAGQQRRLWREVALALDERVGERTVWLNTAGCGVAWLHVRLDDRPKYYAHAPYRRTLRDLRA